MIDRIAEARRRKAAGEFLTQRQETLLREAETPAAAKEPWQMTRQEYMEWGARRYGARAIPEELAEAHNMAVQQAMMQGKPVPKLVAAEMEALARKVTIRPGPEAWELHWREWAHESRIPYESPYDARITRKTHEGLVREAISEGKPVPAEVLRDYPDLALAGNPGNPSKEPWQMTQAEYEPFARNRFRQATEDAIARLEKGLSRFRPGMAQYEDALRGIAMQKQQLAEGLTSEAIRSTHRLHVRKAFLEGKPVPPEVLKDYPELAQKGM